MTLHGRFKELVRALDVYFQDLWRMHVAGGTCIRCYLPRAMNAWRPACATGFAGPSYRSRCRHQLSDLLGVGCLPGRLLGPRNV